MKEAVVRRGYQKQQMEEETHLHETVRPALNDAHLDPVVNVAHLLDAASIGGTRHAKLLPKASTSPFQVGLLRQLSLPDPSGHDDGVVADWILFSTDEKHRRKFCEEAGRGDDGRQVHVVVEVWLTPRSDADFGS